MFKGLDLLPLASLLFVVTLSQFYAAIDQFTPLVSEED